MTLKAELLLVLEQSRDAALSGQALAERFHVSRNAVWKAVNALKEEGIAIESTPNRGYRLAPTYDRASEAGLRRWLAGQALGIYCLDTVDSTNNQAKRLLVGGGQPPFVVVAEAQTVGRGRRGRAFHSPEGGLYMTLAMDAGQQTEDALGVTAFAATAVAEAVETVCGRHLRIKWVNDLFLAGKKVCGILTEATTDFETGTVESLLIGIGINLRATDVPEALRDTVGTLQCTEPVKNRLAAEIVKRLLLFRPGVQSHLPAYRERSLTLGRRVVWRAGGAEQEGLASDIDPNGALIVLDGAGERHAIRSGEVRLLEHEK